MRTRRVSVAVRADPRLRLDVAEGVVADRISLRSRASFFHEWIQFSEYVAGHIRDLHCR